MSAVRECHEEVTRRGELMPCDKTAVALRLDPTEGGPYPVCAYHSRADMVPLSDLVAATATAALNKAAIEVEAIVSVRVAAALNEAADVVMRVDASPNGPHDEQVYQRAITSAANRIRALATPP